jgi:hypothetical protein
MVRPRYVGSLVIFVILESVVAWIVNGIKAPEENLVTEILKMHGALVIVTIFIFVMIVVMSMAVYDEWPWDIYHGN